MSQIIVPPSPGLFSSFGLLYADVEHHYSRTVQRIVAGYVSKKLTEVWNTLEAKARAQLEKDGFGQDQMRFEELPICTTRARYSN